MPSPRLSPPAWRDALRRIEDLGFSSVSVSEHLTRGWVMEATAAMLAAALATDRLRVLSLVLANDYRHPVMLHKSAATIDVLSEGRLELGLGTGWLAEDYQASGIPFYPAPVRIARLEESIRILKGLFGDGPFSFEGTHYRVKELDGLPKPVQRPHPPILVGGGGRRVLELAAAQADVVGVHCALPDGELTAEAAGDLAAERIAEKVAWVRRAASGSGRDPDDVELQFTVYLCQVDGSAHPAASAFGALLEADPELAAASPAVLRGSVDGCVDLLRERRERFGFSYLNLGADLEAVAPIVARLSGT
jgi:probable F420-dependent oxidoreductase